MSNELILNPEYNAEQGIYQVENYEKALTNVKNYVAETLAKHTGEITDKDILKFVKTDRTELRARLQAITKARLQINDLYFGTFNKQLKELETLLKDADAQLKKQVDDYNAKTKPAEPETFTLTITAFDKKIIDAVKEFAIKKGCGIKE